MRILLTGGGTGGHVIPNIALIPSLKKEGFDIFYAGGKDSIEERLITRAGIDFESVPVVKLDRAHKLKNIRIPFTLLRGIIEAKKLIRSHNIDVIFSKGGYVSLPIAIAGWLLHIPVITHESDSSLGLANRIISRFATLVITNNDNIQCKAPTINLGNPIRESIFNGDKTIPLKGSKLNPHLPYILIVGGSSGSERINSSIINNIDNLTAKYNIIHITGKKNYSLTHKNYLEVEFANNIEDYLALADVVVSRSGAGAVAELMALEKHSVLIPLENKSSRGDQLENAERVSGSQVILRENNLTVKNLIEAIEQARRLNVPHSSYDRNTPNNIVKAIINELNK